MRGWEVFQFPVWKAPGFPYLKITEVPATHIYPHSHKHDFDSKIHHTGSGPEYMFQHAITSLVIIYYFFKINTVESACGITFKEANLLWNLFSIKFLSAALYSRRSY